MAALRARLREHLGDWRLNLEPTWRVFFAESPEPDFDSIPEALQIDDDAMIWPGRQGAPVADALAASHICRAFDGIVPPNVRVVVLGQDPYPSRAQATGRAFEDGNWDGNSKNLAHSLKPLMLAALATRDGHEALFRPGQWDEVRRQIADEGLDFPELGSCFDRLAGQGVMFVNAAWTHTQPGDIDVHLELWQPVLDYLLTKLAREAQDPLVFLLLGRKAQTIFAASGAQDEAGINGEGGHVVRVDLPHPRAARFFGQNPWLRVNECLGEPHIEWWPQVPEVGV